MDDVGWEAGTCRDSGLSPSLSQALLPTPQQASASLGQLGNAIGDVRGTAQAPQTNLIFLGAPFLDTDYQASCSANAVDLGAVAIFDPNSATPTLPTMLIPPKDFAAQCYPRWTANFGHSIAVADVDGDNTKDLIVGAQGSDSGEGRVYIFFGHTAFLASASAPTDWIAIQAPVGGYAADAFGATVIAADLDAAGGAELIVCAAQRNRGPGYVLILRSTQIATWRSQIASGHLFVPDLASTSVQKIVPPVNGPREVFGWQMTVGPLRSGGNGRDLAVFAEDEQANVPGDGCGSACGESAIVGTTPPLYHSFTGALYLYTNVSSSLTSKFVEDGFPSSTQSPTGYHKLKSPFPNATYAPRERFGRGHAVVDWTRTDGSAVKALLVGAPGGYTHGTCQAGQIYLYELPIELTSGSLPGPAWMGESPHVEACSHFGASAAALRYDSAQASQQFAVSQREESFGVFNQAGRVYTLRAGP